MNHPNIAEIKISYHPKNADNPIIKSALDAYTFLKPFFVKNTIAVQEQFVCMYLDRANRVIGCYPVSKGGISGTVADVRLILSVALKTAASGIILSHNHPSRNLLPSKADIAITERIKKASELIDVQTLDHIILIPDNKYVSLKEEGLF